MPLPAEKSAWLPTEWAPAFDRYRFDEALWLNNTEALRSIFQGGTATTTEGRTQAELGKRAGLFVDLMRRWGWARIIQPGEKRTDLPVPIGANIVNLSASQLMGEPPRFRVVERGPDGRARTMKGAVQDRLDRLANSVDARMTLLEGAATVAAIGGGVMTAAWDTGDRDRESVWFDVAGADCAIPEFNAAGRLIAVSTWQEYPGPGAKVYRYFQRHSIGKIEHALYLGTARGVGSVVKLDKVPSLADVLATATTIQNVTQRATITDNVVEFSTGLDRLTAAFWRNRPTRIWRRSGQLANLGRSDFELCEPLMDAYSEAWGSMMRDVRLGKARLLVPMGMLELAGGKGSGGLYDTEREIFTEVGGLNPEAGTDTIKDHQAKLRYQEHLGILAGLKAEILDAAGWSMNSYGNPVSPGTGGGQITATEVNDRKTKSEGTRDEKGLLFKQPGSPFIRMLMELDAAFYPGAGAEKARDLPELTIDFPDVSQVDSAKQAAEFASLLQVHALSIEQSVRERRPNWDDDDIEAEVKRIMADIELLTGGLTDPIMLDRADPVPAPPPGDQPVDQVADQPEQVPA